MTNPTHLLLGPPLPAHVETIVRAAMQGAGFVVALDPRDPAEVARALDALDAMRAMLALPSNAAPTSLRCAVPENPSLNLVGFVGYPKLAPGRQPAPPRTPAPPREVAPPPKAQKRLSLRGLALSEDLGTPPTPRPLAGRPRNAARQYLVTPWGLPYVALPSAPRGLHGYEQVLWELWAYGPRLFADLSQRLGVAKSYSARMIHSLLAWGYLAQDEVLRPVTNGPSKIIALAADGPWLREWVTRATQGQTLPQYVRRPAMPRLSLSIVGPVAHVLTASRQPAHDHTQPLAVLRFKVADYPLTIHGLGSTPLPPPVPTLNYPPRNLPTHSLALPPASLASQPASHAPQAPLSPAKAPQAAPASSQATRAEGAPPKQAALPIPMPVVRRRPVHPEAASFLEESGPLPLPDLAAKMGLAPADLRQNLDACGWGEVQRRPILDSPHILLYLAAQASLAAVCAQDLRGYPDHPKP